MGKENFVVGPGTVVVDSDGTAIYIGYIEGEGKFTLEREFLEQKAEQALGVLGRHKISERCVCSVPMKELSLENLQLALDASVAIAEEGSPVTKRTLTTGEDATVTDHLVECYTMSPGGKTRKFKIYKANVVDNLEYSMSKGADSIVSITFAGVVDASKDAKKQLFEIEDDISKDYDLTYMLKAPV